MAITKVGSSSSGDAGAPNTSYTWDHTCHADTNLLVVTARGRDSSIVDAVITSVTYGVHSLTLANRYHYEADCFVEVWYYPNPTVGSSLAIVVTHTGKVSDAAGAAVDLAGADADGTPVFSSGYTTIVGLSAQDNTLTESSAPTGSMMVSGYSCKFATFIEISVTAGIEVDAVDMGSYVCMSAYAAESSGSCTITYTDVNSNECLQVGATFNPSTLAADSIAHLFRRIKLRRLPHWRM